MVDSLDLKSSGIYSRGGSSPPEATNCSLFYNILMSLIKYKIKNFIRKLFPNITFIDRNKKIKFIDYLEDIKEISNDDDYKSTLSNKPIVFDVGSNIGLSALRFNRFFNQSDIHCFEPIEETFNILSQNLKKFENIKINKLALDYKFFEKKSMHTFKSTNLISNFYESTELTKKEKNMGIEYVKSSTIDEYCKYNNIPIIDILRIDINGYEINVLKGAENFLKNKKIKFIHFSFYNINTSDGTGDINCISKLLESYDYRLGCFYNDFIHSKENGGYYFATYFLKNIN